MDARIAATFNILSLPSLPGEPGDLDDHLDGLEAEIERLDRHVGIRSLRPCDFGTAYRRGAELGYLRGVFRIENGGSSAQVSAWDLSKIYQGRVLRMPLSLLALGVFLNPLASFLPVPRIPKVGKQLTQQAVVVLKIEQAAEGPKFKEALKEAGDAMLLLAAGVVADDGVTVETGFTQYSEAQGALIEIAEDIKNAREGGSGAEGSSESEEGSAESEDSQEAPAE